jgi:hypothetical protein
MSASLIAIVTFIYFGVTISEYAHGHNGMALAFLGYAIANIGLIWQIQQ